MMNTLISPYTTPSYLSTPPPLQYQGYIQPLTSEYLRDIGSDGVDILDLFTILGMLKNKDSTGKDIIDWYVEMKAGRCLERALWEMR